MKSWFQSSDIQSNNIQSNKVIRYNETSHTGFDQTHASRTLPFAPTVKPISHPRAFDYKNLTTRVESKLRVVAAVLTVKLWVAED
jgi:hypothetical protein